MILVDVQVVATGEIYDFELDENQAVEILLKEIKQLISEKEQRTFSDEKFYLYAMYRECFLLENMSMKEQGVRSGERLILF